MYVLFDKEKQIMDIFWKLDRPCLISEVLREDPTLSRNTVAKLLVKLEKNGFLRVDSIRKTVTRTGRAYVAAVSKDDYERQETHMRNVSSDMKLSESALRLVSCLLKANAIEDSFVQELEQMIEDYKNTSEA